MNTGNRAATMKTPEHAHHYESMEHQYLTAKFGVWLFLATEILMFGSVFVAYIIYHHQFPEVFKKGSEYTSVVYGATNTIVLLFSSLTMALAIHYMQKNRQKATVIALWITFLCGCIFMGIKAIEYSHKFHEGLYIGKFFSGDTSGFDNLALYFSFYFTMTGIHGFHVLIGMGLIAWIAIKAMRGHFSSGYYTPIEGIGLFWHLIDLIWIYLFPLLYLVE